MKSVLAVMGRFGPPDNASDDEALDGPVSHHPISTRTDISPGVDEQLIAQEDATMALAQKNVAERKRKNAQEVAMAADTESERRENLREKVLENACNPDVCRCQGGKRCNLNIYQRGNSGHRQMVTRITGIPCVNC